MVKKLNLLGYEFDIKFVPDKMYSSMVSTIVYTDHTIYIDKNYKSECMESILHEIIHWIDRQNKLNLTEQQTHSLASNLFCILKENKLLK